jgi:hypothetical protein
MVLWSPVLSLSVRSVGGLCCGRFSLVWALRGSAKRFMHQGSMEISCPGWLPGAVSVPPALDRLSPARRSKAQLGQPIRSKTKLSRAELGKAMQSKAKHSNSVVTSICRVVVMPRSPPLFVVWLVRLGSNLYSVCACCASIVDFI